MITTMTTNIVWFYALFNVIGAYKSIDGHWDSKIKEKQNENTK